MKRVFIYISLLTMMLQNSCSIIIKINKEDSIIVPAGIDSSTAAISDSITNHLFVTEARKLKALNLYKKAKNNFKIADSLWIILTKQSDADSIQINGEYTKNESIKIINEKIAISKNDLRKAIKLNPFDLNIKDLLASVYFLKGNLTHDPQFYHQSIYGLKDILTKEKCDHILYYRLGENYFKLEDWRNAYQNYKMAEKVLLETAFLNDRREKKLLAGYYIVSDSVDSEVHFRYIYYQAITMAKLYDTESALSLFQQAQQIAPSQNHLQLVENYIRWIEWDEGNIAAAENKNMILDYIKEKKYPEAKFAFEDLIKELHSQKARDEISWRIACIEYEFLDQKERACQRLFEIVKNTSINYTTGLPDDPAYTQYISDCGKMFFKLGFDYKKQSKYKDALQCFSNASQINWFGKWKSSLEIAKLSIHDPEKTLLIINQILSNQHNLDKTEQLDVLTLKLNALKSFGANRLEEVKETYRQIRSLQK